MAKKLVILVLLCTIVFSFGFSQPDNFSINKIDTGFIRIIQVQNQQLAAYYNYLFEASVNTKPNYPIKEKLQKKEIDYPGSAKIPSVLNRKDKQRPFSLFLRNKNSLTRLISERDVAIVKIEEVKRTITNIKKVFHSSPLELKAANIFYMAQANTAFMDSVNYVSLHNLYIEQQILLYSIPLNIHYQYQDYGLPLYPALNNFSVSFDKAEYLKNIKSKLKGKFNPEELLPKSDDLIALGRQQAEILLRNEIENIRQKYQGLGQIYLDKLGNLQNLFTTEVSSLRQKFIDEALISSVNDKQLMFEQMQTRLNNGGSTDRNLFEKLKTSLSEFEMLKELLITLENHKRKWQESGLVQKIKESEALKKLKVQQFADAPNTIRRLAKEKLSLNSLQKLFLNLNSLVLGQGVSSLSPLSVQHYLSNGASAQYFNGKNYFSVLMGKHNDFVSLYDLPFSGFNAPNKNFTAGFRFGKGNLGSTHTHLSFVTYKQGRQSYSPVMQPISSRTISVFTLSNRINTGEHGFISGEVSKSAAQYDINRDPLDSIRQNKSMINALIAGQSFFRNMAFDVRYEGNFSQWNLSHRFFFRSAGMAYHNPGSFFLNNGSSEIGLQMKKLFLQKRLSAQIRANIREYRFSDELDSKWRNSSFILDAKWRMQKGQYMGIRYQPITTVKAGNNFKNNVSRIERLTAEAHVYKRLLGMAYHNNISLTYQNNYYSFSNNTYAKNKSVMISLFQNFLVNKHSVYWTVNCNYVDNRSQYVYFNSSLVTDIGYTYFIGKKLNASSALNYTGIKGWYDQVAIRQTLNGEVSKNLSVHIYLDLRKNLKEQQPYYQEMFRAECGLTYSLNPYKR